MSTEWWRYLKGRPFYWVLDERDPAASYYMLRYVVERPDAARAVQAARLALQESPAVADLKAGLSTEGNARWTRDYSGSLWALRLLAEWGVPGDDETIATCLDWALETNTGDSHPYAHWLLLHTALSFGFAEDERVTTLLEQAGAWLKTEREVDAVAVSLIAMAFAASPDLVIPDSTLQTLKSVLSMLNPEALPEFASFAYPTFDTPDEITVAESLLRLGISGEGVARWVPPIVDSQDEQGYWRAERIHVSVANTDTPHRWVSAKAMFVLREYYGE